MKQEPLSRLTVMVTDDCNLSCKGCVTDAQDGKQGKRAIDSDFVSAVLSEHGPNFVDGQTRLLYLFFSGRGEPTLRMDVIEEVYRRAGEIVGFQNLYVGIQTNAVFDERTRKRISDISDIVWVSVDGAPQENDAIRKYGRELRMACKTGGSSEYITRNTNALREDGIGVRIRSTIHNSNVGKQRELVDYAASLGVETVVAEPAIRSPSLSGAGSIYLVNLDEFVDRFVEANNYAQQRGVRYTTGLMEEALKLANPCARRCGECFSIDAEAELPRSATLTTDNRLAGCYLGYEDSSKMQSLTFGEWRNGEVVIDRVKLGALTRAYQEQKGCHGRALTGDAEVNPQLLENLFYRAKFPTEMPKHP